MTNRLRFYIAAAALAMPLAAGAQLYVEPEKDIDVEVFIAREGRGRAQQGMEIWGGYVFSCEDGGHVNIYDFKKASPKPVAGFDLASSRPDNHVNNVEFGVETKPGASFPLLYITNGKVGSEIEWTCFVESITRKGRNWTSEIAQTIVLDGCKGWHAAGLTEIFGAPSWLIDRERGYLWIFSSTQRTTPKVTRHNWENLYVATKFRIPALSEGPEVTLTVDDVLDQVVFPYEIGFTQAGCMRDGKIYYCFGVGKHDESRPASIRIYDTDRKIISARYDMIDIMPQEPEDIVVQDGVMYLCANTPSKSGEIPNIYKVSLPKPKPAPANSLEEIMQMPEKAGGIYYIDDFSQTVATPAPAGYKPFYITGYCRHGARHMDDDFTYPHTWKSLKAGHDSGNLTEYGEALYQRLKPVYPHFFKRVCDLTQSGYRQWKEIGRRMAANYPEVFEGDPYIKTISTSVVRVSQSMASFNLGLQSAIPSLEWDFTDASSLYLPFMNPYANGCATKIPLDEILRSQDGHWFRDYKAMRNEKLDLEAFLGRIWKDTAPVKAEYDAFDLQWRFWLLASVMNGLDNNVPFWDAFTPEEILAFYECENYKYYMVKGPHPANLGRGWGYGCRILENIIETAEHNIRTGRHGIDMRFGHDGVLMATMTALQADTWAELVDDPAKVKDVWHVYDIPESANLQLVFYRSDSSDEILVKAMLNERDCHLPFEAVNGVFYKWSDMLPYYRDRFKKVNESLAETAKIDVKAYLEEGR